MKRLQRFYRKLAHTVALPIIRKAAEGSCYISHYELEGGNFKDVTDLLSLLDLQGHSGCSIYPTLYNFEKAAKFEILSPLKFTDDEFGSLISFDDKHKQNTRLSSVFKYGENLFVDIDSITWTGDNIRLNKNNGEFYDSGLKYTSSFSGHCIVYDEETGEFIPVWSGNIITNTKDFMAENRVSVPCIEIGFGEEKRGIFFANFTLKSKIPQEFYKDYKLTDCRTLRRSNSDFNEEIEFCKENLEKLSAFLNEK